MRILFTTLSAKYIHASLAVRYMYCTALETGMEADIHFEEFTINQPREHVFDHILRGGYDLVCFSCYIWNIEQIRALGRSLKKARPNMKILLGGPEVSFDTREFMYQNPWSDFIISGEGETALRGFLREFTQRRPDYSKVGNLFYWKDQFVQENEPCPPVNMDRLPFPYTYMDIEPDKIIYYESTRGCPFHCSYCISGGEHGVRAVSMDKLRRDMGYFLYKKVKQVKFVDRTFNYDKKRAREIWQFLIDRDNGITNFHFEICADLLDEESYKVIAKAREGLFQFEAGIQSTNQETLFQISRKTQTESTLANVKRLAEIGNSHVHVDLIAGLPGEDYHSFGKSFNQAYSCGAENLQLGFLKLLKGTRMREEAYLHDYQYWEEAPYEVISNKYMSAIDLVKLKMIEKVLDLFHNRGGFERALNCMMEELEMSPFHFYEMLADYYFGHGYDNVSHKKENLYRIIHAFMVKLDRRVEGMADRAERFLSLDMIDALNPEVIDRFNKRGWEIK